VKNFVLFTTGTFLQKLARGKNSVEKSQNYRDPTQHQSRFVASMTSHFWKKSQDFVDTFFSYQQIFPNCPPPPIQRR